MEHFEFEFDRPVDPAELRVRALRDALVSVAHRLETAAEVRLAYEVQRPLLEAARAIQDGDLGEDAPTIGMQFEAFFKRLGELVEQHPDAVPTSAHGLPQDARFLDDMADFITRRYGLD